VEYTPLGDRPGDSLFQVNLCSRKATHPAAYEQITPQRRAPLEARQARAARTLQAFTPGSRPLQDFYNLLCSRSGGEYACANADVKATLVGQVAPGSLEIWSGAGPALEGDQPDLIFRSPPGHPERSSGSAR
jgi:hypothetical protein